MDQLIKDSLRDFNLVQSLTLMELILALSLSTVLVLFFSKVYIRTHSGLSYSKSFVHTIVLFCITVAMIMLLIGSNIARAFSLVGALSVIRFRNPIKDSRDVAFLFAAMAIGMACGTKFYLYAIIFTLFISLVIIGLHMLDFGELSSQVHVLKVRMKEEARERVEQVCKDLCRHYTVIAVDRLAGQHESQDIIYEVSLKPETTYEELVKRLTHGSKDLSVSLLLGENNVHV